MSWFSKALDKVKKAFGKKDAGSTKEKCPEKETGLLVVVLRKDNRKPIEKAVVLIKGQTGSSKKTDKDGIALFKPVEPDTYQIDVTLPRDLSKDYIKPELVTQNVSEGDCPIQVAHAEPLSTLKVYVFHKGNSAKVVTGAHIEVVKGPQVHGPQETKNDGFADFGKTKAGTYTIQAKLKAEDKKNFGLIEEKVEVTLQPGKENVIPMQVAPVNIVTPKIEAEYKVVLLDRNLAKHQDVKETKIYADPTYICVSVEQTNKDNLFTTDGKLKCSPVNVEAYLDEACQNKLAGDLASGAPISNAQLTSAQKTKIYFKGKTAGQFEVTLELEAPKNDSVRIEKPAKDKGIEKIGVVELQMKLHQQDIVEINKLEVDPDTDPIATYYTNLKNKAFPDQKEMTDEAKVKEGRLLHLQSDGNFGRAKVVCKKLNSGHWPTGTDDYEIVLKTLGKSGGLVASDKEFDGNLLAPKVKVSDLKAADKTFWVEGKETTKKFRDVRLYLGIDRPEGGLAKTVKRNADWAKFTVVRIKEVKVEYTATAGRAAAWDSSKNRFYINLAATWNSTTKKFTTDGNTDVNGRKVTIGAQLSEKFKDITIHFMLAPDKNNQKAANWGKDMPASWKWKDIDKKVKHLDKADRKKILHLSAKTDDKGYAKVELILSRFGGDVFWPACYISEDAHLGKYVDGHADLEKRKPAKAAHSITVWKKFWYQEVKVAGVTVAGFGNSADTYRDVKTDMLAALVVEMPRATADAMATPVIYKKHMVSYYVNGAGTAYVNNYPNDNGVALVVGDATETSFFSLAKPVSDKPVMIPILNAHALWVADGLTSSVGTAWFNATGFPISLSASKSLLDPPQQGGTLFKSGRWTAEDWNPAANGGAGAWGNSRSGDLAAANISLSPARNDPRDVQITKPAGIVVAAAGTRVKITGLILRAGKTYLGTSYPDGIVNSYTPNDLQDFINTINHEIGHSLKQVTKVRPTGIPGHPNQYDRQGSHCNYTNKSCLMYESGPQPTSLNRYCPVCHPYVLIQDMSKV